MKTAKILSWLVALVGLWTIVSPYILGYSALSTPTWHAYILGIVLIILGIVTAVWENVKYDRTLDWITAVVGLWLVVSPFVLAFSTETAAMWNNIIAGVVVIVLAVWAALMISRPVLQ